MRRLLASCGTCFKRQLASGSGGGAMTPYRQLEAKRSLYARVRTEAFRRFADRQQAAAEEARDPQERLRRLGEAYLDFGLEQPEAYRIMFEMKQPPADRYPELEAEQRRAFSYLLTTVEELLDSGALCGDALTIAHVFWAQVHGLVSLHLAGKLSLGRTLNELRPLSLQAPLRMRPVARPG
jgi:AcrR family transcriptional regulator